MELISFSGLCNVFYRSAPTFSEVPPPLNIMTRNEQSISFLCLTFSKKNAVENQKETNDRLANTSASTHGKPIHSRHWCVRLTSKLHDTGAAERWHLPSSWILATNGHQSGTEASCYSLGMPGCSMGNVDTAKIPWTSHYIIRANHEVLK